MSMKTAYIRQQNNEAGKELMSDYTNYRVEVFRPYYRSDGKYEDEFSVHEYHGSKTTVIDEKITLDRVRDLLAAFYKMPYEEGCEAIKVLLKISVITLNVRNKIGVLSPNSSKAYTQSMRIRG